MVCAECAVAAIVQVTGPLVPRAYDWLSGCLKNLFLDSESACDELDARLQELAGQWYEIDNRLNRDIDRGYDLVYEGDTVARRVVRSPCMRRFSCNQYQKAQLAKKIQEFTAELNQKWISSSGESSSDHQSNYRDVVHGDRPVGMNEKISVVEGLLTGEAVHRWVGAYGMAGAGKTLLATTIKEREAIKEHFDGMVFFITFGKLVNLEEVLHDLMKQVQQKKKSFLQDDLTMQVQQNNNSSRRQEVRTTEDIARELGADKFLLIVDDVWEDMIERLKEFDNLLRSSSAARIFVTCRNIAVLTRLHAREVHIEKLNHVHSEELFLRHAHNPGVAADLVSRVVEGCEGLPLALKVIGSFMAAAAGDTDSWNRRVDLLEKAKILEEEETQTPEGRSFIMRLKLSYDALPTTKDIKYKECFFYLAMWQQGASIFVQDLSLYWEAEGLLRQASDGSKVFRKLEQHGLVENLRPGIYKLHDVIHVLATDILEKERRGCYVQWAGERLDIKDLNQFCKRNRLRRMFIERAAQPLESEVSTAAHTIALFLDHIPNISRSFITSFVRLKVLVMTDTSMTVLPKYIALLTSLVTLDISHNQSLINIPIASISSLTKLAHLDIRNCQKLTDVRMDALLKLSNLSFLHAENSWSAWKAGQNSSVKLELLGRLPRLERVWIDSELSIIVPNIPSINLVKLHIRSKVSVSLQDGTSSLWSNLTRLEELCLKRLNQDMDCGSLCSRLRICELEYVEPSASGKLQHLLSLEELRLRQSRDLEQVPADMFTMLKVLELWRCHSVSRIPVILKLELLRIRFCNALEKIEVHGCHRLESIELWSLPRLNSLALVEAENSGNSSQTMESLPKLRKLWIFNCPALSTSIQNGHRCLEELAADGVVWEHFGPFPALTYLKRRGNDELACLARVDASELPRLRSLYLDNCQELPQLPKWLANQISALAVGAACNLTEEWVGALVNLKRVNFYREVPDWVEGTTFREIVNARGIHLVYVKKTM